MICICEAVALFVLATSNAMEFPENPIPMIRSSCRAPAGSWRFGYGRFETFTFSERLSNTADCHKISSVVSNDETWVNMKLQEPWFGFTEVKLAYNSSNRMYKVVLRDLVPLNVTAAVTGKRITQILEYLSYRYNTPFSRRPITIANGPIISEYTNVDEDYLVSLMLSRCNNRKELTLSVESVRVKKRSNVTTGVRNVKLDLDVDI